MKFKVIIATLMMIALYSFKANAQQEYMITQYMYNGLALNPAYAGVHGDLSVGALWREQWTAIDGAPSTQLLTLHSPLKHRYASLGAVLYRDVVGVKTEYTGYFSYAYRIRLNKRSSLSMGIQMNLHNFSNDISRMESQRGLLQQTNTSDPLYQQFVSENLGFKWNFGAGLMMHSENYYIGVSVPQLLERPYFENTVEDIENSRLVRHLFMTAGYVFNTGSDIVLKPNVLVKAVESAPVEFDLNLNALLSEVLWLGVSMRSELSQGTTKKAGPLESITGLIALQASPQFQIGYSYDFTTTAINTNTHEIMLNYVFSPKADKILSPRYF